MNWSDPLLGGRERHPLFELDFAVHLEADGLGNNRGPMYGMFEIASNRLIERFV